MIRLRVCAPLLVLLFLRAPHPTHAQTPLSEGGYEIYPLEFFVDLLSGMLTTDEGIIVCDRGAGKLIQIQFTDTGRDTREVARGLDTPVDIAMLDEEYLVLQQRAGSLIGLHRKTGERRLVANGFLNPSALTVDDRGNAYIVDFDTGELLKVELASGEVSSLGVHFELPADILFAPPDRLVVADQVGSDDEEGAIYTLTLEGQVLKVDRRVTDPTGLALASDGTLYVTSFRVVPGLPGSGGVLQIDPTGELTILQAGLSGPTSLVVDAEGNLVVLEEPENRVTRLTLNERAFSGAPEDVDSPGSGQEGIRHAARLSDREIVFVETAPSEELRIRDLPGTSVRTLASPLYGYWLEPRLTADRHGSIYISDPLQSAVEVYDRDGIRIGTIANLVPDLLFGHPYSNAYALEYAGETYRLLELDREGIVTESWLRLAAEPLAATVRMDNMLVIALANGEVLIVDSDGGVQSSLPLRDQKVQVSALAPSFMDPAMLWILDSSREEIRRMYGDGYTERVGWQTGSGGTLLADPGGVLYMNTSGTLFQITDAVAAPVEDWSQHNLPGE